MANVQYDPYGDPTNGYKPKGAYPMTWNQFKDSGQTMQYNSGSGLSNIKNAIQGNQGTMTTTPLSSVSSTTPTTNTYDATKVTGTPGTGVQNIQNAIGAGTTQSNTNTTTATTESPEMKSLRDEITGLKSERDTLKTQYDTDTKTKDEAYNQILEAKRAAVRAAISKATGQFNQVIADAPQQFQGQRDTVSANRMNNMQNVRRSLANLGYNPDSYVTRQESTDINVGAENQINQLDTAQKKVIQDAQNAISNLQAQGELEDANAIAEIAMQRMTALDNLKQVYMQNLRQHNSDITSNIGNLVGYMQKDKERADQATYQQGVLENTKYKNLYDAMSDQEKNRITGEKNYFDAMNEQEKNNNTANKNKWDASGYMMPEWAQVNIPEDVLQTLAPYAGDYAQAAQDLQETNPELAQWAQVASVKKMFDNPELLRQHGSKYATLDNLKSIWTQANEDRKYGLDVNRFNYGIDKDDRDFNYTAGRDNVKDKQWMYDYGLKEWVAKDSSARGWDSNSVARQNANTNAYSAETGRMNANRQKEEFEHNKSQPKASPYFNSVYNKVGSLLNDLSKNPQVTVKDAEGNVIKDYVRMPGSVEHKQLSDTVVNAIKSRQITPEEGELIFNTYNIPY